MNTAGISAVQLLKVLSIMQQGLHTDVVGWQSQRIHVNSHTHIADCYRDAV